MKNRTWRIRAEDPLTVTVTKRAFTLIELLVVIAIIAILAAILFPVFAQAREKARQSACLSNMKQVGLGLMMYNQDFDETMPIPFPSIPAINGGNINVMPIDSQIYPYIKNDQVWSCLDDSTPFLDLGSPPPFWDGKYNGSAGGTYQHRTYGYVASISTREANGVDKTNTGMCDWDGAFPSTKSSGRTLADIDQPADTIAFVESATSPRSSDQGSPYGALFYGCDTWKLAGRAPGADGANVQSACTGTFNATSNQPYVGHNKRGNYVFADGHVKSVAWGQVLHNDFELFKLRKSKQVFTP